jgi:lysophospholipase L1-like esterase
MKPAKINVFGILPRLPALVALALALNCASAQQSPQEQIWTGSWSTAVQIPEPQNSIPPDDLRDATVRQIVHLSIGGNTLRIRLSNAYGTAPLHFTSVHIARPLTTPTSDAASPAIDPTSDRPITFSGSPDVLIPAGAEYLSDPIAFAVAPLSSLAITFHIDAPPARETGHPGSRATTWYLHGDLVASADLPNAQHVEHWYQLAGVDILAPPAAASIIALGDSITDGHASTTNGNDRWTDVLAARLQSAPATHNTAVLNLGIGGNHLLTDGLGPNTLARFDRDVLAQPGAHWLIVFEGVNDLGGLAQHTDATPADHAALVARIIAAYQQIIDRAHTASIRVYGATITPYGGSGFYHPGPADEAARQTINTWIRTPGHFDAVLDFDQTLRDPAHPDQLLPTYDCGDHLHPNPAGYRALANAVPLDLFTH